jgi:hypothetical protein
VSSEVGRHQRHGTAPIWLDGPWVQAGTLLGTLLLFSGTAYLVVLRAETLNPRRVLIAENWSTIREHESTARELSQLGPPDEERLATESLDDEHACIRELTWYTWREDQSGQSYSVCLDAGGVVRRKSEAMTFNLRTW